MKQTSTVIRRSRPALQPGVLSAPRAPIPPAISASHPSRSSRTRAVRIPEPPQCEACVKLRPPDAARAAPLHLLPSLAAARALAGTAGREEAGLGRWCREGSWPAESVRGPGRAHRSRRAGERAAAQRVRLAHFRVARPSRSSESLVRVATAATARDRGVSGTSRGRGRTRRSPLRRGASTRAPQHQCRSARFSRRRLLPAGACSQPFKFASRTRPQPSRRCTHPGPQPARARVPVAGGRSSAVRS